MLQTGHFGSLSCTGLFPALLKVTFHVKDSQVLEIHSLSFKLHRSALLGVKCPKICLVNGGKHKNSSLRAKLLVVSFTICQFPFSPILLSFADFSLFVTSLWKTPITKGLIPDRYVLKVDFGG